MSLIPRPSALVTALAFLIAACGSATGDDAKPAPAEAPAAPCKHFHDDVMPTVDEKFIATGKVKFIYREYPLNDIDVAAYAIANCAGEDKFFDVLDDLFEHQQDIFDASKSGTIKQILLDIAARHGITDEKAFDACTVNRAIRQRIADTIMTGDIFGVHATPTFVVNGQVKPADQDARSGEAFEAYLNGELAKLPQ